jgi:hypothetical protein
MGGRRGADAAGAAPRLPSARARRPIVRRVEPGAASVWIALHKPSTVTLQIYGASGNTLVASGKADTVAVGANLHLVVVTARPPDGAKPLEHGALYRYNVFFGADASAPDLFAPNIVAADRAGATSRLLYGTPGAPALPSFALPPPKLDNLRVVHGSCRKSNGEGKDALGAVDVMIAEHVADPLRRPHLLPERGNRWSTAPE